MCWQREPLDRPDFQEIAEMLSNIRDGDDTAAKSASLDGTPIIDYRLNMRNYTTYLDEEAQEDDDGSASEVPVAENVPRLKNSNYNSLSKVPSNEDPSMESGEVGKYADLGKMDFTQLEPEEPNRDASNVA